MKKQVTLQFPTFQALWNFKNAIRPSFFEMSPGKCMLSCECSEKDIELAVKTYQAKVVETGNGVLH